MQAAYAGDKAMEITNREREVVRAWLELQNIGESRKSKLNDTSDLFKFFAMVRKLCNMSVIYGFNPINLNPQLDEGFHSKFFLPNCRCTKTRKYLFIVRIDALGYFEGNDLTQIFPKSIRKHIIFTLK